MKKQMAAGFAAVAIVAGLAGCTQHHEAEVAPTSAETTESYTIDSWQTVGRAGVEWFGKCEENGWGCYNDQLRDLQTAVDMAELTPDETHTTAAFDAYHLAYQQYLNKGCGTDSAMPTCTATAMRLSTMQQGLQAGFERMASES